MRNLLKNRLALSTVVTTLIILVVSVLLAGVVTYFAINVTSTRVQEESITLQNNTYGSSASRTTQAAYHIINTGGRDIVINKITVRGQEDCDGTDQGLNVTYTITTKSVSYDLKYTTSTETNITSAPIQYNYHVRHLAHKRLNTTIRQNHHNLHLQVQTASPSTTSA